MILLSTLAVTFGFVLAGSAWFWLCLFWSARVFDGPVEFTIHA